jgi:pfkB family carbohydrate kinase
VHLSGISLGISPVVRAVALTLLEAVVAARVSVSFDPNLRLNLWPDRDEMRTVVDTFAAQSTVVMPGIGEGQLLTGRDDPEGIAKTYLDAGAREVVVIKLGAEGAQAWTAHDKRPGPARSPSPLSTPSAPATASLPATLPLSSTAAACENELIKVLRLARWPPPDRAIWMRCRRAAKSTRCSTPRCPPSSKQSRRPAEP